MRTVAQAFRRRRSRWVITARGSSSRTDPQITARNGVAWYKARGRRLFGVHVHEAQTVMYWHERLSFGTPPERVAMQVCTCGMVRCTPSPMVWMWARPCDELADVRDRPVEQAARYEVSA